MEKHVLGLVLPTDPRWVNIAEMNIREVLIDHAYCEQKAASSCISLIILYPENELLVETLTPIVAEEWSHFQAVMGKLKSRGWKLGPQRKDIYVSEIMKMMKKGGSRNQQMIEKLLFNALIEARSCERFRLLSKELSDPELAEFYHQLMVSEAGHYKCFISLAKEYEDATLVEQRWREILKGEGEIMKSMSLMNGRLH